MKDIEKILNLADARIKHFIESKHPYYKGHETFMNGIFDEIVEAKKEIKKDNSVYLEDEL